MTNRNGRCHRHPPYEGKIVKAGETVTEFKLKSDVLFDEVRAGGRINLIIGRSLTAKAANSRVCQLPPCSACPPPRGRRRFHTGPEMARAVGKARAPGTYCEPKMTTVGSQDTTGPMTRDERKDLAAWASAPTW